MRNNCIQRQGKRRDAASRVNMEHSDDTTLNRYNTATYTSRHMLMRALLTFGREQTTGEDWTPHVPVPETKSS